MCLATLQQERVEALVEFIRITDALKTATHARAAHLERQYEKSISLILQIENDIKLVQRHDCGYVHR